MRPLSSLRTLFLVLLVATAAVLQTAVFPYLAWHGVVPNLVLLVVVATALVEGPQVAMVLGFGAGLLLDLSPPADHLAGRWALALLLVGLVVGTFAPEVRTDRATRPGVLTVVGTVAGASFLGTSLFALSGLVLRDAVMGVPDLLGTVAVALLWDVLLTPLVVPAVMVALVRLRADPDRVLA